MCARAARCSSTSCVQVESMVPRKALAWDRVRVRVRVRLRLRLRLRVRFRVRVRVRVRVRPEWYRWVSAPFSRSSTPFSRRWRCESSCDGLGLELGLGLG